VLFEPFIIRHLKERGFVHTVRSAKKMIERGEPAVWDILDEVIQGHPVMLNRAPTLHRLSIQAFNPVLIEGSAIRIHPLVCTAYNADFDGDQMAVHVPLSNEAQLEAKLIMLASNNIFSPSSGKPITSPTQDVTLGIYYLNAEPNPAAKPRPFCGYFEVLTALAANALDLHDPVRIPNPDRGRQTIWGDANARHLVTTPGRCIFNEIWPPEMGFHNGTTDKKTLGRLISDCYKHAGHQATVRVLDQLKELGFEYATRAGFSISIADMVIPPTKDEHIERAREDIRLVQQQYNQGVLTDGERHNKICDIWTQASNRVANDLFTTLNQPLQRRSDMNPIFAMLDSGARGSRDQIRQLAGMRGLMSKPSGDIIERPIIANFREGLSVLEYFISTHGARKGLADTALKTADSGYMTRKLVDVAQDLICREEDCGTVKGIWVSNIIEGDEEIISIRERVLGRFSAQNIRDPLQDGGFLVKAGEEITPQIADLLVDRGINRVFIRSVLTCETRHGTCVKCYGRNLANDRLAVIGDALGIIAAQSIGEPGTQLTMRTFHIGGTATSAYKQPLIQARQAGTVQFENVRTVDNEKGETIVVNKNGFIVIYDADRLAEVEAKVAKLEKALADAEAKGDPAKIESLRESLALTQARRHYSHFELDRFEIERGAILAKRAGQKVKVNEKIISWDPYNIPIIAEESGKVVFRDLIEGVTFSQEAKRGGVREFIVLEHREDLHPQIVITDAKGEMIAHYPLPAGAHLMVNQNASVKAGAVLARVPRQLTKNKDITGGLPRVAELFEARRPREVAEIARIDGVVELGKISRGRRQLIIRDPENNQTEEHIIPATKHLSVGKGDLVKKGQKLTEGSIHPQELLDVCGPQELQEYLVNEIQLVYRAQGVEINDNHIEIIVRQMLQKVRVTEPGSTLFLPAEEVERQAFLDENARVVASGGQPAQAEPILLGITKASIETESFISAASFQDTTRVLTEAATLGKIDYLTGFKENVITGHLIPAGTGTEEMQSLRIRKLGEELAPERELEAREEPMRMTADETARLEAAREMLAIDDEDER